MPTLGTIRRIPEPSQTSDKDWEKPRVYASPDGTWALRFSDPYEWAMGASSWRAVLLNEGQENTRLPDADTPLSLEPWSSNSRTFAYTATSREGSRLVLMGVDGSALSPPEPGGYLVTAQWAPNRGRLLVVGVSDVMLLDEEGTLLGIVPGSGVENEWPVTGWLQSGEHFFVLARASKKATPEIVFYSAGGAEVGRRGLDPTELVPYDAEPYRRLRRDFWSLEVGPGTSGIGSFLDRWSSSRYESTSGKLELAVHRPTSPPFEVEQDWGKEWMCRAEEQWVEVNLAE